MARYVCAFRGRRDYYQVPLALAESGSLERFITDAYAGPFVRAVAAVLPQRMQAKAQFRREAGIPDDRVSCLWGTTALEHLRHRLGCSPSLTFAKLDQNFSCSAARCARRTRANLFLYSSYAWEAFTATYRHQPRKVLFQYHPHPEFERQILETDFQQYPEIGASFREAAGTTLSPELRRRETDSWRHADLVLCASSFTRESLLAMGADSDLCRVISYGIDTEATPPGFAPESFNPLFVGIGVQRKGLHHLLQAWRNACLPENSCLTLVCRRMDPELEKQASATARVRLVRGAAPATLKRLFAESVLFVMPSLVEGFGQVYLEALALGTPVLGTKNTALPDLGDEKDGIFLSTPGLVDELTAKLEYLANHLPGKIQPRTAAWNCARRFSWGHFRKQITKTVSTDMG